MPSSEVRYQRGDHYRQYNDDLLQQKRSSSSASSVLSGPHRKKPARTRSRQQSVAGSSSVENYGRPTSQVQCYNGHRQQEDYLTKKKVE